MATAPTPRMGIERPLAGHAFSRQEQYDAYTLIDGYPGQFLCTSGTRPSGWGSAHIGMKIFEIDTSLVWRWTGSAFVRDAPLGLLANPSQRTTDFSTASSAATAALSNSVIIPAFTPSSTNMRIKVEANFYAIDNGTDATLGASFVYLMRGSTQIARQRIVGRPDTDAQELNWGQGGTIMAWDDPPAGAATYHLSISTVATIGGTSTLRASATTRAQLAVSEVGL